MTDSDALGRALALLEPFAEAGPSERQRIRSEILAALENETGEVRAFVAACLTNADAELGSFLAGDVGRELEIIRPEAIGPSERSQGDRGDTAGPDDDLLAERRLGSYRLIEKIGEGGMGTVYRAEQTSPVRRTVALKVIRSTETASQQFLARFEAERQALALMNHPNIARVFDGGTFRGQQPYLAMEYVPGIPITDYCDRNRLTIRERLELFRQACHAAQHAHQKGIIHRDLKPSNVLVRVDGDEAICKVIDFGVARAIDRHLTERTIHTLHGQVIGTAGYLSPEQAEMGNLDIDTRTDVYSLGVMLYELLCGDLPIGARQLQGAAPSQWGAIIDRTEPLRPSVRASQEGDGQLQLSQCRRTEPRALIKQLQDDLDWIVMKAIEKDRTRRYSSAAELCADIDRHLRHETVLAGPPTASYRFSKFLRRHRALVGGLAAIFVSLVAGLLTTLVFYFESEAQADRAEEQKRLKELALQKAERNAESAEKSAAEARDLAGEAMRERARAEAALLDEAEALRLAELREEEARRNLDELLQLSSIEILTELQRRADLELWPALPKTIPDMVEWVELARAEILPLIPPLEDALTRLEAEALPYTEQDRQRDLRTHFEAPKLLDARAALDDLQARIERARGQQTGAAALVAGGARAAQDRLASLERQRRRQLETVERLEERIRTLEFEGDDRLSSRHKAWRHRLLRSLVWDLRDFRDGGVDSQRMTTGYPRDCIGSSLPDVVERIELASRLEQQTVTGVMARRRWKIAISDLRAHPDYGLDLSVQAGLLPIGKDPQSGLWEFAVPATGRVPHREKDGSLVRDEETALILVLVPGGSFDMGAAPPTQERPIGSPNVDPDAQEDEAPVHRVRISPFFLSKYEMTQGQWERAAGDRPSYYSTEHLGDDWGRHPVENVSWIECRDLLLRLDLCLPTEAQWEYAARAHTSSVWWSGDDLLSLAANIIDRPQTAGGLSDRLDWDDGYRQHAPIGSFPANPFGLHDVHGNVWEWCRDVYCDYSRPPRAGDGLRQSGERSDERVARGGSFTHLGRLSRSADRGVNVPHYRNVYLGVRPARPIRE